MTHLQIPPLGVRIKHMNFEGHNSVHSSGGKIYKDTHTEMEARREKEKRKMEGEGKANINICRF